MPHVLIAGESWIMQTIHIKGFDSFTTGAYGEGVAWLRAAIEAAGHTVEFMPNHIANTAFPTSAEALVAYDVVILSDIGSNTLLLHNDTFVQSRSMPNRLALIRDFVAQGGALVMIGGYLTFQGSEGQGRGAGTPVEEALPVTIDKFDDRVEAPEGMRPRIFESNQPIVAGLDAEWPAVLGYNRVTMKPLAIEVVKVGDDPLVAIWDFKEGRSMAFTTDCGPHWAPVTFVEWDGYAKFWANAIAWLTRN